MAVIYRSTDRKKLIIGDVTFTLAPVTYHLRKELEADFASGDTERVFDASIRMFQHSIKAINGIHYDNGDDYDIVMDFEGEASIVSRESIEDILNMPYWNVYYKTLIECLSKFSTRKQLFDVEGVEQVDPEAVDAQPKKKLTTKSNVKFKLKQKSE